MTERVADKLKRAPLIARPVSEERRKRLEDLKEFHDDTVRRFSNVMKALGPE
jgi:hypothetical protein